MTPTEVRQLREERLGLTQEGLAARFGVSVRQVQRWESPKFPRPTGTSLALLELLDDFPALIRRLGVPQ